MAAAIEFGIQPMLFQDATGAPLYAPYPLSIAIPAMMIGHLSFAGLAEMVISGSLIAYLQRAHPELLRLSGPGAPMERATGSVPAGIWTATRRLWLGLAVLMIATPLGLLAAGMAWGEWGVEDFKDPAVRLVVVPGTADAELALEVQTSAGSQVISGSPS